MKGQTFPKYLAIPERFRKLIEEEEPNIIERVWGSEFQDEKTKKFRGWTVRLTLTGFVFGVAYDYVHPSNFSENESNLWMKIIEIRTEKKIGRPARRPNNSQLETIEKLMEKNSIQTIADLAEKTGYDTRSVRLVAEYMEKEREGFELKKNKSHVLINWNAIKEKQNAKSAK